MRRMQSELAAPAQGHALDRRHHGNLGVLEPHGCLLESFDHGLQLIEPASLCRLEHLLEVGAQRKRSLVPQHQRIELTLGPRHCLQDALDHRCAQRVMAVRTETIPTPWS